MSIVHCCGGEGEPNWTVAFLRQTTGSSSNLSSAEQGAPQMVDSSGSIAGFAANNDDSARWTPACDVFRQAVRSHTHATNEADDETFLAHTPSVAITMLYNFVV
jgi:hypothetical protein